MKRKLKGVTFDFDATFYNYPLMVLRQFPLYIAHLRLIYGLTVVRADLRKRGHIRDFRRAQAEVIAERWNRPVDEVYKKIEQVVYEGWNKGFSGIKPERDAHRLLQMLEANGIRISVVSDYPPWHKMKVMGFDRYNWSAVINCEDIGHLKPNPQGFMQAMRAMGTAPFETMHVGDSLRYDIVGAKKAGMIAAWLRRWWKPRSRHIVPDYEFYTFAQLMDILEDDFGLERI